jgi:hypothetical protein
MRQVVYHKFNGLRIVRERRMNIKLVNGQGWSGYGRLPQVKNNGGASQAG